MRLTSLRLITHTLRIEVRTTSHNSLRWLMQAIDCNAQLASSLQQHAAGAPLLVTDSIHVLTDGCDPETLPKNTHIVFWDGINSYVELLARQPRLATRVDLKFYVVGWLEGVALDPHVQMEPLYPAAMPEQARAWKNISFKGPAYLAPYWYRTLTTLLTHARFFKNRLAEKHKHDVLARGEKIVFCGLVTPTEHNVNSFFIGAHLPALRQSCQGLTALSYSSAPEAVDAVASAVLVSIGDAELADASAMACIYSVLNVLHRIKTLSLLHGMNAALFVNETRNSLRFDPYDCFRYKNNLYLDFGSTRGPDAIYPRTVDLHMTGKRFVSLRLLAERQTLRNYLDTLSWPAFCATCMDHAQLALTACAMNGGEGAN
jgi:hypothetical protein